MTRALRRLAGNAYVLSQLSRQRTLPYAPRAVIEAARDARVRRLVRYAARTVPYYQETFRRLGLDARDLRTADDLARLPILDKDELRRDPERFVARSRRTRDALRLVTSGSTGQPARIAHDARSLLANMAFGERERAVVTRIVGSEVGYREAFVGYRDGTLDRILDYTRERTLVPVRPRRLMLSVLEPLHESAEQIAAFAPDVLLAYGNWLLALARAIARGAAPRVQPKLLVYGAEGLTREMRREIEEVIGAPLLSRYNSVEVLKIAFTCEAGDGFHVHEDLCHVRMVDGDGRPAPEGTAGQVVLSNLVNHGTVLLNYRIADVAAFAADPCSCGRTLRTLRDVDGRVEDVVLRAGGRLVHPRAVWSVVKPVAEVEQYQLVQRAPDDFLLRLVIDDGDAYARVAPRLAAELAELLGDGARVATERCTRLAGDASGKVRLVVALAGNPTAWRP